ncbi:MAG: carboxymuconolactone decarboxylase family protein [Roseovarius sp.]
MARVRDVEIHEVPAEVQPIYERYATEYGPFLNQVKVFAHRPPALKHIMGLLLELHDEALVPKRYLEIALVTVSTINKCEYCISHHAPRALAYGLSAEALDDILAERPDGFDEVDILVRDFSEQVTSNFQYMRDAIFDEMKRHFTEEQLVELTMRIALCGFFNRVNDALQIENEDGVEHLLV